MLPRGSRDTGAARLVERRLREWELQRDQMPAPSEHPETMVQPYVAISRAIGSGAREVAESLSKCLGWTVYDRELLEHMAQDDQIRRRLYQLMDERSETWFEDILRPITLGQETGRNDYFHRLQAAIAAVAAQESVIFLGRGAGLMLPEELGLHIRLTAPRNLRIRRLMASEHVSEAEAIKRIDDTDRQRRRFLETHFGQDPYHLERFDLTINTANLPPAGVAEVILAALRAKWPDLACG